MKLKVCIVCALAPLTAVMVMAQETAPTTPPAPAAAPAAPAVSAPAPAPAPEAAPAAPKPKAPTIKKRVELDPPVTGVVKKANVNVRGQASFLGETLGHLQKGDKVAVSEEITLGRHAADEPAQWARIALPAGIPVWVDGVYVDPEAKTIKVRRVNLRGGPGENFSVVGHLEKGAAVKEIKTEKGWISIEAPTNAYAFVAAEFLDILPPAPVVVTPPPPPPAPAPPPQVVVVNTPAPPVPAANEAVVAPPPAPAPAPAPPAPKPGETEPQTVAPSVAPPPSVEAAPAASSEPVTPRIVTREGFVRRAYNIQAPADYELHDILTGEIIDYLQPKPGQNFKIFVGTRVTVTGPEGLDKRWHRTPVIEVQNVDLMP